ncbi:SPFH domain-containing protein [Nocardia blacklockiae]|uniref:SPFH domain-containing protein n=1 Tax=Nocardia blacklockiae TaxID=480036 RepID=UPI001893F9E9|nr:SPFH domain-containing protein [Nocardia blacklockiae]MBF6175629.1 SPFH domain-containing protein [Nocardia blacklockiae]
MAWFEREFIAVPEERKNQLVYKWPDVNIRRFTRAIVNADEVALFVRTGQVVAALGPGRHRIDAQELPVLGALVDSLSGNNFYRAELYFVSTREFSGIKFGGRLADIADPVSEQIVTLRAFGEFALSVRDPAELITSLAGTADLASPAGVQSWSAELLMKSMKVAVTQGISRGEWPILGLPAHLRPIEDAVLRQTNLTLYEYGLRIARMGNFDITLAPEDADRLKRLAKDVTYIRLTGDFQRYAAGELALGASAGLSRPGGDTGAGMLGAALGLNAIQAHTASQTTPQAPAQNGAALEAGQVGCPACHTANPAHAKFCMNCGGRLSQRFCGGCGAELLANAQFCTACGTPAEA